MIDLRPVLYTIGWLLLGLAVAMWAPVLLSISAKDNQIGAFLSSIAITAFVAGALIITNRMEGEPQLTFRQASILTSAAWIVLPAFGAIPFVISTLHISYTDAYFETVSGMTTTGSTVLSGLDHYPASILIWRSILQWLGGFGIIAFRERAETECHRGGCGRQRQGPRQRPLPHRLRGRSHQSSRRRSVEGHGVSPTLLEQNARVADRL